MYVAGIDCGTQSTKVLVYDHDAKTVVTTVYAPHRLIARDDGSREQKAAWWAGALEQCFGAIPEKTKARIVAVGVSGQQHGFVPLSKSGKVIANVKLWNDTSTTRECDEIHVRLGGRARAVALAGNPILPGYTASKILWLKKRKPDAYRRLHTVLLPHDYLNYLLTGSLVTECGDASGTGFLDVRARRWSRAVLKAIDGERDLLALLPPLIEPDRPAGAVPPSVASWLGLPSGTLVASGGGDNMMAAIGTGAVRNGVLTVSLGTSGTLFGFSDKPVVPKASEFAAFCSSSGGWLPLVCTMNCTSASELMRELFGIGLDRFDEALAASSPGAGGITALPFFSGERTPDLPRSKAALMGLAPGNTAKENVLRAVVEATVYGLKTGLADMKAAGIESNEIRVIGGGSNSRQWLQIVADVLDAVVLAPVQHEAAAFGAALQALWCYGAEKGGRCSIQEIVEEHVGFGAKGAIEPIAANFARYDCGFEAYLRALHSIAPLYQ
jgi:xylulokinase